MDILFYSGFNILKILILINTFLINWKTSCILEIIIKVNSK